MPTITLAATASGRKYQKTFVEPLQNELLARSPGFPRALYAGAMTVAKAQPNLGNSLLADLWVLPEVYRHGFS